jgi:DNA-binding response OmpR family regulator
MDEQKKNTILIIEDESPLNHALSTKLTYEGFSVLQAFDGEAGLALALEKHPDVILLDIIMPKMDGIAVIKKLQEDEWGRIVPIILLTNLSDELKVTENFPKNVVAYLVKSDWKLEDIVNKIREKLSL